MKLSRKEQKALGLPVAPVNRQQAPEQARELFLAMAKAHGLPVPVPEWKFHPNRKWRFDWAIPCRLVALEIQGAIYTGGRHTRGPALVKEYEKLNEAQMLGWKVLLVTPQQVNSGEAFALVKRALDL